MTVDRVLKGHDMFQSLSIDDAHQINSFSSVKKYRANEMVFKYGEAAAHVYMLLEGSVNLRLPANPADFSFVISKIEKGELFGLSPLLNSSRFTSTAQCIEPTELLSIEAQPFREMLMRNEVAGFNIISQVAHIYFTRYIEVLKSLQGVVGQISLIR
ncbi:MAG: cyclic nucleotide-binding domain-containing protein [candidate division Zixibacteria bacterium]|nr:cyclic nucleotide-binding domain-containing protein [candidate division Zixibacteria bacterium]